MPIEGAPLKPMARSPDMERLSTGIVGLDEMIEGGFPRPSVVLVAGSAGTGKTTFAQKFLFEGARKGEQGIYFTTLSEPTEWMLRFVSRYGFVEKNFFGREIIYVDIADEMRESRPYEILSYIEERVNDINPDRIVIDPITVVGNPSDTGYRQFLFDMTNNLKRWDAVSVVTGEVDPGQLYPPEVAYSVDGIVLLLMDEEKDIRRKYLEVLKMRGTNHVIGKHSIDITSSDGIVILKSQF
jgi:circadian clock protein KaiC